MAPLLECNRRLLASRFVPAPNYPATVNVDGPNVETLRFFEQISPAPVVVAELGCYKGHTTRELLKLMPANGQLHVFDFEQTALQVTRDIGDPRIKVFSNSTKVLDSYNWSLMKVLSQHDEPIYDFVFIDGAHTWHHDALAFLLVDRLLKIGGHVDFDDYSWTLRSSPSLNPSVFPKTGEWYTDEQIDAAQVALVVELLVRRDRRYLKVVPDRIFRKL